MGYFSNDRIAGVIEPNKITLANTPNFVQFTNKGNVAINQPINLSLKIKQTNFPLPSDATISIEDYVSNITKIKITEAKTSQDYSFKGTYERDNVNSSTFFVARKNDKINGFNQPLTEEEAFSVTAQNIRACLLRKPFFRNNFEVSIVTAFSPGNPPLKEECEVEIVSRGSGSQYNFTIECSNMLFDGFSEENTSERTTRLMTSYNTDTIDAGSGDAQIELDIYTGTDVFLGESGLPSRERRGNYLTTLAKAYLGEALWFDSNLLISRKVSYSPLFLEGGKWHNSGTVTDYRFIARRTDNINSQPFYYSDVLYVLNGYNYALLNGNLEDYVFDVRNHNTIKPLSNRPQTTHCSGQKQYFNFIMKDALHSAVLPESFEKSSIGLIYRFWTQSGIFITEEIAHLQTQEKFNIVNTIEIELDKLMAQALANIDNPSVTIGRVEVMLCCEGIPVSEPLIFDILPEGLHKVNDFAFLNRLGGWDSFNFGGTSSDEFKTAGETIYETLLPGFTSYSRIESVAHKSVTEQKTVSTRPLNKETIEWLRELSASIAVYELSTKRYVIVDNLSLKYNAKDDLFQAEMKYRYTDTFNGKESSVTTT